MIDKLKLYLPENSLELVNSLIQNYPIQIKIVNKRATKQGDFKWHKNGKTEITINNNLNKFQFLITLIHEYAHFITFLKNKNSKPHGNLWKQEFKQLMLPFLQPTIFPESILKPLANYLINPKASTLSDANLTFALLQFNKKSSSKIIQELPEGTIFNYKNKSYKKIKLRRTRILCEEIRSKKLYLFNKNTEISF
ncbi:MAG: SprT-like domain-containing protein [Lutibacter sp.]